MKKLVFEDISTGGGCVGYFTNYKKYTFYITTLYELNLPKKNQIVSLGIYNKDFEDQFASITIHKFDPEKMDFYVKDSLKKYLDMKKTKKHKMDNDIFYLDD